MAKIIKGYTIERELMRQGLRITALAHEDSSGRKVVIKVFTLPPGVAAANAARARHRNLVERSRKLAGEEFVPLLAWGEEEGKLYLVHEHALGLTLSEVLEAVKRLPVELAGLLFQEITRAVQKAHSQGIAQLDLDQANIIFRQDGKVVFTDWVKEVESAPAGAGGEQVQKYWQQADENLDLFAMGILFARVLTGDPGLGPEAAEAEIVVKLSQRLREDPGVPEGITKIIRKLLGEEFERYEGAREVLEDLKDYIKELGDVDPREAWQRFLSGPEAFVEQLNQWKASQVAKEAKDLMEKGKVREAKAGFERALTIDPNNSVAEAELELLAAREGFTLERLGPPSKTAASPAMSDIFEKIRASESLGVTPAPTPKADDAVRPVPAVPEAEVEAPDSGEIKEPVPELIITTGIDWDQPMPASPEPQAPGGTEIFASGTATPVVITQEESNAPPEPVTGDILIGAQAVAFSAPDEPRGEEASISAAETPVEQAVPFEPQVEKPGEGEGKDDIGFGEAVAEPPVEEAREAPGEGGEAQEGPSQLEAGEFVAQAREGQGLPWKLFGFILLGVAVIGGALFMYQFMNKPKEVGKGSEALYQEGLRAQEVGDFDRALAKLGQVARDFPQTPEARLAMSSAADLEWRLGRQEAALDHYQMVSSGNAQDSLGREARFHRALILREQKKPKEALAELSGFILDMTAANRTIEAKMVAAQLLHEQGLADSSLAVYGMALDQDRGRVYAVEMHKERGLIREEKGDWKAARDDYDAILSMTQPSDLSHVWAEQKASAMAVKMMSKGH
jgi:tetratricopeptide (TPR) repeat protein